MINKAVFDEGTQTVTFTNSLGGTVTLDLGSFITATELTSALTPYTKVDGSVAFTAVVAGITPTDDAHLSTKKYVDDADDLKASVSGATFTGAARGIAPRAGADFVTLTYFNANKGGGVAPTPVVIDDLYFGLSDDAIPEPDELNIEGMNNAGEIPAYVGSKHQLIARLASEADITSAIYSSDPTNQNQFFGFVKYANTVIPTGESEPFTVWVSFYALTHLVTENLTVA